MSKTLTHLLIKSGQLHKTIEAEQRARQPDQLRLLRLIKLSLSIQGRVARALLGQAPAAKPALARVTTQR